MWCVSVQIGTCAWFTDAKKKCSAPVCPCAVAWLNCKHAQEPECLRLHMAEDALAALVLSAKEEFEALQKSNPELGLTDRGE